MHEHLTNSITKILRGTTVIIFRFKSAQGRNNGGREREKTKGVRITSNSFLALTVKTSRSKVAVMLVASSTSLSPCWGELSTMCAFKREKERES